MDREDAEFNLTPHPNNTFLVRSKNFRGEALHVLSLKTNENVRHMRIEMQLKKVNHFSDLAYGKRLKVFITYTSFHIFKFYIKNN